MKILFDHHLPFALAHGGFQTQIEETRAALMRRGIEVEYVRWWDERQRGDLFHHFGAPSFSYLKTARQRKMPSVVTHLFSQACNRSWPDLLIRGAAVRIFLKVPLVKDQLNAQSFRHAQRMVVGLEAERRVLQVVFGIEPSKIVQVPLGLPDEFLQVQKPRRSGPFLITTGTIYEVKRSIELAKMARAARVPILFVGKPYRPEDAYGKEFARLVDGQFVLYREHVTDRMEMIDLLKSSRGFVLYSRYENWSLSAQEAAACGLPLLVPDLPWARERFGAEAHYLHPQAHRGNVARLRAFYEACPDLPPPAIKLYSWDEVAEKLEACYCSLLAQPL